MKKNIFITGAGGCVGHYLFDVFAGNPDYNLYIFIRHPGKLKYNPASFPDVTLVRGDLRDIGQYSSLLKEMDYVAHVAAGWGETELNYEYTINLFNLLDPDRLKKVIYFSTASLLGPDNKVMDKVGEIGTSYIKGKYKCYREMPQLKLYDKIITLFPTWVLGGDALHPYSHATEGLRDIKKWLWLLRFLTVDFSFHFIHARDIALMVEYLIGHEAAEREFVLGNKAVTADQMIDAICAFYKAKRYFKIKISPKFVRGAMGLLGQKISEWDSYCLEQKSFIYKVSNPATFGITPAFPRIEQVLASLG